MEAEKQSAAKQHLPQGIQIATAWAWRLLLIGVAAAALIWLISQISLLVIPVLVAVLLAALLQPVVVFGKNLGLPHALAVTCALLLFLLAVSGLVYLIVTQFTSGLNDVWIRAQFAWDDFLQWLADSPLHIDVHRLDISMNQVLTTLETYQGRIWSSALGFATSTANFFAGALLTLFSLVFFLLDGKRIWFWVLGFFPARAHASVHEAAKAGWTSVGQYVRVQILVAFVDAVGVAIGAWALQLPLVIPIGIMVFLGSFIPFLGAITTGAIAAVIALIYNGPTAALIMVGVVLLVNQLEGNILQPLVMGNAVKVHPLGVVLAVSLGAMVAKIPGALFAVPIAASANAIVNTLMAGKGRDKPDPLIKYHQQRENRQEAKKRLKQLTRLKWVANIGENDDR